MVSKQDNLEIAKDFFLKGEEKMKSAEILLNNKMFDDAVSRIYYAAYYFAKALLFLLGEEPRTHKGLISIFGLKVIKTGFINKKFGAILNELFEKRERSDYDLYSYLDFETTQKLIQNGVLFREEIKKNLKEKFGLAL